MDPSPLLRLWAEKNAPILHWAAVNGLRLMEDDETVGEAALVVIVIASGDVKSPLHERYRIEEAFPATEEHVISLSKEEGHLLLAAPPRTVRVIILSDDRQAMPIGVKLGADVGKDRFVPQWKEKLKEIVASGRGSKVHLEGVGEAHLDEGTTEAQVEEITP